MLSNKLLTTSTEVEIIDTPQMNYVTALLHADGTNGGQNNTFINQTLPLGAGYNVGYFDGTGDYLTVSSNTGFVFGTGAFTIEAWVSVDTIKGQRIYDSRPASTNGRYATVGMNSSGNFDYTANSAIRITGSTVAVVGQWYHVAVCRSATSTRLFVNGVQEGVTYSDSTSYLVGSGRPFIAADGFTTGANAWQGYISNFRVLKGVALYTSNFSVPTSPLTAITGTTFLTCNSATFVDQSVDNLTITAVGNASVVNLLQTLTRTGNVTQGSFSPYGDLWSNYFNGASSQTFPALASTTFGTGDFTVEAWVYLDDDPFAQYVIDNRNSSQTNNWAFGFGLGGPSARGRLGWFTGSVVIDEPTISAQKNTWTHMAAVRSGTTLSIFVNGVRVRTATDSKDYNVSSNTAYVGARHVILQSTDYLKGYLSNLRVVKSAVYDPSQTTLSVPTSPLLAITNTTLLTCQSNRFRDASSNNFAITRVGSPSVQRFTPFIPTSSYDPLLLGGSSYFDGSGDTLTADSSSAFGFGSGDFTVEFWYYYSGGSLAADNRYIGFGGVAGSLNITQRGGIGVVNEAVAHIITNTGVHPDLGAWTHIALTRQSGTLRLFKNGLQFATVSSTVGNATGTFLVRSPDPQSGYISDVRVIKGTALYTANFTPPTSPILPIANTSLLLSATNAAIFDSAVKGNWETQGTAQLSTSVKKFGTASLYLTGTTTSRLFHPYSQLYDFALDTFTFEAWIYPTRASTTGTRIFSTGGGTVGWNSTTGIHLLIQTSGGTTSGGQLNVQLATNTSIPTVILNSTIVPINQWSFISVCVIGSTAYVGVNGNVVSGSVSTRARPSTNPTVNLGALVGESSSSLSFQGYMDEVRITKGIARYTTNFVPPTEPFADF